MVADINNNTEIEQTTTFEVYTVLMQIFAYSGEVYSLFIIFHLLYELVIRLSLIVLTEQERVFLIFVFNSMPTS